MMAYLSIKTILLQKPHQYSSLIKYLDIRTGVCYRSIAEGQCSMGLADAVFKKSNCCCSAFSRAWGSPCEICPLKNTCIKTYFQSYFFKVF